MCAVGQRHEGNLIILIILHCPDFLHLFFGEFIRAMLAWISVFRLGNIDKGGVVFIADIIFQSKPIKLVKQDFDFFQCRIVFTTGRSASFSFLKRERLEEKKRDVE